MARRRLVLGFALVGILSLSGIATRAEEGIDTDRSSVQLDAVCLADAEDSQQGGLR